MSPTLSLRSTAARFWLILLAVVTVCIWHNEYMAKPASGHRGRRPHRVVNEKHIRRADGLLEVNMAAKHPIPELMEAADRQWENMIARQSETLEEAVQEYRRRNGYMPPAGFDLWWDFARDHNVKLVDEFDQINYDVTPYLALSPATFRARVDELADLPLSWHINVTKGQMHIYGPWWMHMSSLGSQDLALPFSGALPDLVIHTNAAERVTQWIGEDLRSAADERVRERLYFTDHELRYYENTARNPHRDLKNACLPNHPVFSVANESRSRKPPDTAPDPTQILLLATFIVSHLTSMSPCFNQQVHNTPPLSFDHRARPPRLVPQFVYAKMRPDSGFVLPGPVAPFYEHLLQKAHTWAERAGAEKLFWRGKSTGWTWSKGFARTRPEITWRDGLRARLALMFGEAPGLSPEVEVLVEGGNGLIMKKVERQWLNEQWMDIGMLGDPGPVHCDRNDGTCDEMQQAPIWKEADRPFKGSERKFVVDVDSQDRSEIFRRYLSWGNVVFKATLYTEWNHNWLIPYYHYIPIQTDYSDVYNHMAFFLGDPETGLGGHQDLAEEISQHASSFTRDFWRWEDMQAYMFRLLLEYARLVKDDREAASFRM